MSSLYGIHKCIVVIFILIFECVTVGKECVMNYMFQKINTLSSQSVTTQCACVTRDKKMLQKRTTVTLNRCSIRSVIVLQSSNTFLDVKKHMTCVPIGQTVVILKIVTQKRCVNSGASNTFFSL